MCRYGRKSKIKIPERYTYTGSIKVRTSKIQPKACKLSD